ncbi:asparaginase [Litorisediminicola beolgyonensis]|uniref:Asparaginase n=1 Tax=Litorisediminicola beolgyonensis TaxID=1173614 RepID=A0ABW3ZHQ3_9RHOB
MPRSPAPFAEIWRGDIAESHHVGHAVICDATGDIVEAWGDPEAIILPRSSAKMIQAMPLVTSGAAEAAGLTSEQLALACASHEGAPIHIDRVAAWLSDRGLSEDDLRCGAQPTRDRALKIHNIKHDIPPNQLHNNCSGKHAGFLTLNQHLGGGPEYHETDHPVQRACLEIFEDLTGMTSPGYGIDGCSAPNFATSMHGMARAMARFASATEADVAGRAMIALREAMMAHPMLVAGEGRACTRLMQAATEPVAVKTGAEGYFTAILPERGFGIAVKCIDGATRGAECAIAALLVRLGAASADHPDVAAFLNPEIPNRRGVKTGEIRPAPGLLA